MENPTLGIRCQIVARIPTGIHRFHGNSHKIRSDFYRIRVGPIVGLNLVGCRNHFKSMYKVQSTCLHNIIFDICRGQPGISVLVKCCTSMYIQPIPSLYIGSFQFTVHFCYSILAEVQFTKACLAKRPKYTYMIQRKYLGYIASVIVHGSKEQIFTNWVFVKYAQIARRFHR